MYTIKRIFSNYREEVRKHFLRLDQDSRHSRFCFSISDSSLSSYVDKLNFTRDGIFAIFNSKLEIIGIGECVFYPKNSTVAEVGFSIEKAYQGKGLGNKLMKRVIQFAHSHQVDTLEMFCLSTNAKSMHLARKHGLKIKQELGESHALIDLPKNLFIQSLINEHIEDTFANVQIGQTIQYQFIKQLSSLFFPTLSLTKQQNYQLNKY